MPYFMTSIFSSSFDFLISSPSNISLSTSFDTLLLILEELPNLRDYLAVSFSFSLGGALDYSVLLSLLERLGAPKQQLIQ